MKFVKRICSIAFVVVLVMTVTSGCGKTGSKKLEYAQSPDEAVELYVSAMEAGDGKGIFLSYGLLWDDSCEEYATFPTTNECKLTVENINYKKLQGNDYELALDRITQYWLNGDWMPSKFVYNAFDVCQIGEVSFELQYDYPGQNNDEQERETVYLSIVETEYGWFLVDGD